MPWRKVRESVNIVGSFVAVLCFLCFVAAGIIQLQFHGFEKRVVELEEAADFRFKNAEQIRLKERELEGQIFTLSEEFKNHTHYYNGKIK